MRLSSTISTWRRGFGRGNSRGGGGADRRCFNCDQSGFNAEHIAKCPARNATFNFCRKTGHYEWKCRGRRATSSGRVGLIHKNGTDGELVENDPEENVSNYGISVRWVTDSNAVTHGWDSDSSTDYDVMSVRRKQEEELKVVGAKLALRINGHGTQAWIDSGSSVSTFTIKELKRTIGTCYVRLRQLDPKDDQFRDYWNNPLKFMGKMVVTLQSDGWTTKATINVIGECRPSIIGRDLMPELVLMLVQAPAEHRVHNIQKQGETAEQEEVLDDWKKHFSKQFYHLFHRVGRIRNYKVQAEFFKNLVPLQQKGRRVPITLQEKVDNEGRQGHIQKLEEN